MLLKTLLLFSSLLVFQAVFAQNTNNEAMQKAERWRDSVRTVLATQKEDSNKVKTLLRLSNAYWSLDHSQRDSYGLAAINLAEKIGFLRGQLRGLQLMSAFYRDVDHEKSIQYALPGYKLSKKYSNNTYTASFADVLAHAYTEMGNYFDGIPYSFVALKEYELLKDRDGVALQYNSLGLTFNILKNYQEALRYHHLALNIRKEINQEWQIAQSYLNIGDVYANQSEFEQALDYTNKALEIYKKPKMPNWGLPFSYYTMANIFERQGNVLSLTEGPSITNRYYAKALNHYSEAQKIYKTIGSTDIAGLLYINIGASYYKLNKLSSADSNLQKGLMFIQEMNAFPEDKREAHLYLSKIDSIRGNWKAAHAHFQQYIRYRDLLFNEENTRSSTQQQMKYEFEKKEAIAQAKQAEEVASLNALNIKTRADREALIQRAEIAELRRLSETQVLKQQNQQTEFQRRELEQRNAQGQLQRKVETQRFAQEKFQIAARNRLRTYALITALSIFLLLALMLLFNNRQKQKANYLLGVQKEEINAQKLNLENTLLELRSTQSQLIQSEKLASLGELTAGIAHEIQNPLNFVNNFAEVSAEMLDEMHEELEKGDTTEAIAIATDLKANLEKINHHGQRASAIVKGMLEHSRASTGVKEPTDLNALADEFLRLAYHGLRAKDNNFNAKMETHFDPDLPKVSVIPQDIGRVLLNLINNAFYAVQQRATTEGASLAGAQPYVSTVIVSTKKLDNAIEISIKDNGNGIPDAIREKIFQPFFTTKPTGQGTGLGLSLAYDIVAKGHGGSLEVVSNENEGSEFIFHLPC